MNTPLHTRLASFAFAAVLTLATLAGIDGLATSDTSAPLFAQAGSARA